MKSESHHVWKLLYYTLYIIDVYVCVWLLKNPTHWVVTILLHMQQTTTIGWAFWSQHIKVTTMHHTLNNKHLQNYWYVHIVVVARSTKVLTSTACSSFFWPLSALGPIHLFLVMDDAETHFGPMLYVLDVD